MPIQVIAILVAPTLALVLSLGSPTLAVEGDPPGAAAQQLESGPKKVGEGISETASGVGEAVVQGANAVAGAAKSTGRVIGRAGKTVAQGAKGAWETVRDRLIDFGDDVVRFLKRPF
jgi:type IV secretory pathway TrbL component